MKDRDKVYELLHSQRDEEPQRTNAEQYRAAAHDVVAELAAIGFDVDAIGDLVRTQKPYPTAVPVLMHWLPRIQYVPLKEDIVRTLSVPWAREAAPLIVDEFRRANDKGLRWAMGNALEVLAHDGLVDDMIELATDRRFDRARQMVVLGLGKLRDPRVPAVLLDLLTDDVVVGHAVMALGKFRVASARSRIASLLEHPQRWIRVEAKKALERIDKANAAERRDAGSSRRRRKPS